jgi:hypothetical protein
MKFSTEKADIVRRGRRRIGSTGRPCGESTRGLDEMSVLLGDPPW